MCVGYIQLDYRDQVGNRYFSAKTRTEEWAKFMTSIILLDYYVICFIHKYVQQIALLSQILVPKLECGRAQI